MCRLIESLGLTDSLVQDPIYSQTSFAIPFRPASRDCLAGGLKAGFGHILHARLRYFERPQCRPGSACFGALRNKVEQAGTRKCRQWEKLRFSGELKGSATHPIARLEHAKAGDHHARQGASDGRSQFESGPCRDLQQPSSSQRSVAECDCLQWSLERRALAAKRQRHIRRRHTPPLQVEGTRTLP